MRITLKHLRSLLFEASLSQIKVKDQVTWSGDGQVYDVYWASSAKDRNDSYDLDDSERTGLKGGTHIPQNWYAYITQVNDGESRYVPVSELSAAPKSEVDQRKASHFNAYVSDPFNPRYAIRFTESASEIPDANRIGNHDTVPNGVYAFSFVNDLYEMIVGDDQAGVGIYLEDILVGTEHAFIMKCNFKNPLVLNKKSFDEIFGMSRKIGNVKTQEYLLNEGYDAIIDPSGFIDGTPEWDAPQICFLTNDSFKVVETLTDLESNN